MSHHLVHGLGKPATRRLPLFDGFELKVPNSTQSRRSEVLMRDCIPPIIQRVEIGPPSAGRRIVGPQFVPKLDTQPGEVRTETGGLGITSIQLPAPRELGAHQTSQRWRRSDDAEHMVHAFRMQIATKSLKMRGEQHSKCAIDLLSGISAATLGSANCRMGPGDLIEFRRARRLPMVERSRWHDAFLAWSANADATMTNGRFSFGITASRHATSIS
jgi:hypothetical protein